MMEKLIIQLRQVYQDLQNGSRDAIAEAVALLRTQNRRIAEQNRRIAELEESTDYPPPEAPASATAKVVDPVSQLEWLVTVRQIGAGVRLIEALPEIGKTLTKAGFVAFDAYVDQRRAERANGNVSNHQPPSPPPAVKTPPTPPPAEIKQDSFQAETLAITVNNGKQYFKVQGGHFQKFGVTVWPEVLEAAGWEVEALNPLETYSLAGYTAVYQIKPDGKPDKVVELRRG